MQDGYLDIEEDGGPLGCEEDWGVPHDDWSGV